MAFWQFMLAAGGGLSFSNNNIDER